MTATKPNLFLVFNPHDAFTGSGGGGDAVVYYPISTKEEAEAGTSNEDLMTPLRVKESIDFNAEAALPEIVHAAMEDYQWIADIGDTPRDLPARASAQVIEAAEFGVTAGGNPTANTTGMLNALTAIGNLGGRRILQLPPGIISITATDVAADEGTSFILGPEHSNICIRGAGRDITTLSATSNRIEMFAQVGANSIEFSDMTFESPSILQNTPKQSLVQVGGGVAHLGNGANTAIRQYKGEHLSVKRLGFKNWCMGVAFTGDYLDNTTLHGVLHYEDIVADNYVQALICNQPQTINFVNVQLRNGRDSINSDGTIDPGHGIYISDRSGAHPELVMIDNIRAHDSYSSIIKVRKGQNVVVHGVTAWHCGRGIEINNCMRATASDISVTLADNNLDSGRNGLNFDNCGIYEVSNVFIDMRGMVGYGVRVRPDPTGTGQPEYPNQYGRLSNITVMNDYVGGVGLGALVAVDQNDLTIENFRLVHVGAIGNSRWPIQLANCLRARVLFPQHSAVSAPPDAYALVSLDATCTDCSVIFHDAAIDVPVVTNTVADTGVNNEVTRIPTGMRFPDGSVTAPSINFAADTDNGFWRAGTNVWAATAGGVEQMRFFSDRVTVSTNLRSATDGAVYLGATGIGWKGLVLTPQSVAPAAALGMVALSDGTISGTFGSGGAGMYRYNGSAWVFVG